MVPAHIMHETNKNGSKVKSDARCGCGLWPLLLCVVQVQYGKKGGFVNVIIEKRYFCRIKKGLLWGKPTSSPSSKIIKAKTIECIVCEIW